MRANVNLDADAYAFASSYANAKGLPLGAAVSELIKHAEQTPVEISALLKKTKRGLLVKAKTSRTVTSEMVKVLAEDVCDDRADGLSCECIELNPSAFRQWSW